MAKCEVCGREMLTAKGCTVGKVHIGGKVYDRIRCGGPRDFCSDLVKVNDAGLRSNGRRHSSLGL
jgi:hypothetical protein